MQTRSRPIFGIEFDIDIYIYIYIYTHIYPFIFNLKKALKSRNMSLYII